MLTVIATLILIWLASLLLCAAGLKLIDLAPLRASIGALSAETPLHRAGGHLARIVVAAELAVGVLLLGGVSREVGAVGATLLGTGFAAAGTIAIRRGSNMPCGCSSDASERFSYVTVARGAAIAAAGIVTFFGEPSPLPLSLIIVIAAASITPAVIASWMRTRSAQHVQLAGLAHVQNGEIDTAELSRLRILLATEPVTINSPR